jgi:hypothetical protein
MKSSSTFGTVYDSYYVSVWRLNVIDYKRYDWKSGLWKSDLFFLQTIDLKGQCHEIFDPPFFRQSIIPRPLINTLKYFRILFRIRRAIYKNVLIPRYAA